MKCVAAVSLVLLGQIGLALPVWGSRTPPPGEMVSIDMLTKQIQDYTEEQPDDPDAYFKLGWIHCLAYAQDRVVFTVAPSGSKKELPRVPKDLYIPISSATLLLPVNDARLKHLTEGILVLRDGLNRNPEHRGCQLSLGYAYQEAAKRCVTTPMFRAQIPVAEEELKQKGEQRYWEDLALAAFRSALAIRGAIEEPKRPPDINDPPRPVPYEEFGIYKILRQREKPTEAELEEVYQVEIGALQVARSHFVRLPPTLNPSSETRFRIPENVTSRLRSLYPDIAATRNAAEYYTHAIEAHVYIEDQDLLPVPFFGGTYTFKFPTTPYSEETLRGMSEILRYNHEALRLIHEATSLPGGRFRLEFELGLEMDLRYLGWLGQLARLAALKALHAAEEQDSGTAVESLLDAVAVAQALCDDPVILSQMKRMGIADMIVTTLQEVLNRTRLDETELAQLQVAIHKLESIEGLLPALQTERLFVEAAHKPVSPEELAPPGVVLSQDEAKDMTERMERAREAERQKYLEEIDRILPIASLSVDEFYAHFRLPDDFDPTALNRNFPELYDGVGRYLPALVQFVTRIRVAQTALALERYAETYGELPGTLEVLAPEFISATSLGDPYSGGRLLYDMAEEHYVVYSEANVILNADAASRRNGAPSGISFRVAR